MTFVDDALLEHLRGLPTRTTPGRRLLFLSRVIRAKGVFIAIEILERVQAEYPDATLLIAGDGPDRPEAERIVRERGVNGVRFTGHITGGAKHRLLAECDLFLFPSTYGEGVPISLLEAMAAGLPAVTTRVGGIPDFFRDGEMGESLPEADPARMAEAVTRLLASPGTMSAMSACNAAFVREHCTAAGAAARFMNHYDALRMDRQ
jgi:glycosyltransferase involved in cell wall biosynthesis